MLEAITEMDADALCDMLNMARTRTLESCRGWSADQLLGPRLAIVNPPLWEMGHLAWFQEYWCLRYRPDGTLAESRIPDADQLYNSAIIPHDVRWDAPLLDLESTQTYLEDVLNGARERLAREGPTAHLTYFIQLAVFHEVMHCEAFTYARQTLGYSAPSGQADKLTATKPELLLEGDAEISGGRYALGASPNDGFAFDNQKWEHMVEINPFRMARTAVSNAEFAAFVDDGGYTYRKFWSEAGWHWRKQAAAVAPMYWRKQEGTWFTRRYDGIEPLPLNAAAIHINWYEAQAYCNWAGRRLPTEAEWEFAASTVPGDINRKRRYPWGNTPPTLFHANLYGGSGSTCDVNAYPAGDSGWGLRQMFGNVWEWTADWFNPYPGFVTDPYKEYSQPWFGNHKVLRGGCHATSPELLRNTWRNFYTPDRRDVFAGIRTCAL